MNVLGVTSCPVATGLKYSQAAAAGGTVNLICPRRAMLYARFFIPHSVPNELFDWLHAVKTFRLAISLHRIVQGFRALSV
jgi:hypothetical protein